MFALEIATDELAATRGLDPIELRIRNEPDTSRPVPNRRLAECLLTGADWFGWATRDSTPGVRRDGKWLAGTGVASSVYPATAIPGTVARIEYTADDRYAVRIGAVDIGTDTWTALTQIAADALDCYPDDVDLRIGDTDLTLAAIEGSPSSIEFWGSTIRGAAQTFLSEHGCHPIPGATTSTELPVNAGVNIDRGMCSCGAQFADVRVNAHTGDVHVARMLGVFSVGRAVDPTTLRAQLINGMTTGLSMALRGERASDIDAVWLDGVEEDAQPVGSRGAGEIGIVGAAAAVANAVYHATGRRVRDLPITCDEVLGLVSR